MKSNRFISTVAYGYGIFATVTGIPAFISEAIMLPGIYKVLVWAWIPLLVGYWLTLKSRQLGRRIFWQVAFVLVIASDVFLNFYVTPKVVHESGTWAAVLGVVILSPLYASLLHYAFIQRWTKNKLSDTIPTEGK